MKKKVLAYALVLSLVLNSSIALLNANKSPSTQRFNPPINQVNDPGVGEGLCK